MAQWWEPEACGSTPADTVQNIKAIAQQKYHTKFPSTQMQSAIHELIFVLCARTTMQYNSPVTGFNVPHAFQLLATLSFYNTTEQQEPSRIIRYSCMMGWCVAGHVTEASKLSNMTYIVVLM